MKAKTIYCVAALSLLLMAGSCADYDEHYGFIARFPSDLQETGLQAAPDSYTLTVQATMETVAGEPEILEAGFIYRAGWQDWQTQPGEYADGTITATLAGLDYSNGYDISPYIDTPEGRFTGNYNYYALHAKDDFAPVPDVGQFRIEMPAMGRIAVTIPYTVAEASMPATAATMTLGSLESTATLDDGAVTAEFDLSRLTSSASSLQVEIRNEMGATADDTYLVGWSISAPATAYTDNAVADDHVRLCGVNWAKGNLQYANGAWRIAPQPWHTFQGQVSNGQNEYFSWGDPAPTLYTDTHTNFDDYVTNFGGNPALDAATAGLGSPWATPDLDDLRALEASASAQHVILEDAEGGPVEGMLLWPAEGNRRIKSGTAVYASTAIVEQSRGIFLPFGGYYDARYGSIYSEQGYYMSCVRYDRVYDGFPWYLALPSLEVERTMFYDNRHQLMVRPKKIAP